MSTQFSSLPPELKSLLNLKNFGERQRALVQYARRANTDHLDRHYQVLQDAGAYHALNALALASGAPRLDAAWATRHPSAIVRHTVVRNRLLSQAAAESLLLSDDTSREMRMRLVESGLAPTNEKTLAAAASLDGEIGGNKRYYEWALLQHAAAEQHNLVVDRIADLSARSLGGEPLCVSKKRAALLHRAILDVLSRCYTRAGSASSTQPSPFTWEATWITAVAACAPRETLRLLLVVHDPQSREGEPTWHPAALDGRFHVSRQDPHLTAATGGVGALRWGGANLPTAPLLKILVRWACGHHFELVLELVASQCILAVDRWTILGLLVEARCRATFKQKVRGIVGSFMAFDFANSDSKLQAHVKLLPSCIHPARTENHAFLLDSFWSMVRQCDPTEPWRAYKLLATKLPGAALTADFLSHHATVHSHAILPTSPEDFAAEAGAHSIVAKRSEAGYGRRWAAREAEVYTWFVRDARLDDEQRARVFKGLLTRSIDEGVCSGESANALFVVLMERATEPNPLKAAYEALLDAFGRRGARAVLDKLVSKMTELEERQLATHDGRALRYSSEGLPIHWVQLLHPPDKAEAEGWNPCRALLVATLQSMTREAPAAVLEPLCARFGRQIFWKTFEQYVAAHRGGGHLFGEGLHKGKGATLDMPPVQVLNQLTLVTSESSPTTTSIADESEAERARTPMIYNARCIELKKAANVKDGTQRLATYLELIQLAADERHEARPAVYTDLMALLLSRLKNEQENVRLQCVHKLLLGGGGGGGTHGSYAGVFEVELWLEHLPDAEALWKVCANSRLASTQWKQAFRPLAREVARRALEDWGGAVGEAALDFAAMVLHECADDATVSRAFIDPLMLAYAKREHELRERAQEEPAPAGACGGGRVLHEDAVEWAVSHAMGETEAAKAASIPRAKRDGGANAIAPLPRLFGLLQLMADGINAKAPPDRRAFGGLSLAWTSFASISRRWHVLLRSAADGDVPMEPSTTEFVLAGVLEKLTDFNVNAELWHLSMSIEATSKGEPLPAPYEAWWLPITESIPASGSVSGGAHQSSYDVLAASLIACISSGDQRVQVGARAINLLGRRAAALEGPLKLPLPSNFTGGLARWKSRWASSPSTYERQTAIVKRSKLGAAPTGYVTPNLALGATFTQKLPETLAAIAAALSRTDGTVERSMLASALRIAAESPQTNRRAYDAIPEAALPHLCAQSEGRLQVLLHGGSGGGHDLLPEHFAGSASVRSATSRSSDDSAQLWLGTDSLLGGHLDRYLEATGAVREERVLRLFTARTDAPLLLFFGERYLRHLLHARQELFHRSLASLLAAGGERTEFYHLALSRHSLARLTSALHEEGLYGTDALSTNVHTMTWLLHQETQELILRLGLMHSTERDVLWALPRLEFVDVGPRISEILRAFPKAESPVRALAPVVEATPLASAAANAANSEAIRAVHAKFEAMCMGSPPRPKDAVQEKEVNDLILSLSRADDAELAMRFLSEYASESKAAREAISTILPKLSRSLARSLLASLVEAKETRLGARVSLLRLALDMQLPDALGICVAAYREGTCHRDVLAILLSRLAFTPGILNGSARTGAHLQATVRPLFQSVASRPTEDATYICQTVLREIGGKSWNPPWLVETISESWAFVPQAATDAFAALANAPGGAGVAWGPGVNLAQLLRSVTSLLAVARSLGVETNAKLLRTPWASEMRADWGSVNPESVRWDGLLGIKAKASEQRRELRQALATVIDPTTLRDLSLEILYWYDGSSTTCHYVETALNVWVLLLRSEGDSNEVDWIAAELKAAVARAAATSSLAVTGRRHAGKPLSHSQLLFQLATAAVERALELEESTSHSPAMHAIGLARCAAEPGSAMERDVLISWAKLLQAPTAVDRKDDVEALFESVSRLVAANTRDGVRRDKLLVGLEASIVEQLFCGAHRWDALRWLAGSAACSEPPRSGLAALADFSARAVVSAGGSESSLVDVLHDATSLFDRHKDSDECGVFVGKLVAAKGVGGAPLERLLPRALEWLGELSPQQAVLAYSQLLESEQPSVHIEPLLSLCETHRLPLPALPPAAVEANVGALSTSRLVEARVVGAHALAKGGDVGALERLLASDPSAVVQAVARSSLVSLRSSAAAT